MSYCIGKVYLRDKKRIYITSGSYLGGYGRVSNHWTWKEINEDGTLGVKGSGYGDMSAEPFSNVEIEIRVIFK